MHICVRGKQLRAMRLTGFADTTHMVQNMCMCTCDGVTKSAKYELFHAIVQYTQHSTHTHTRSICDKSFEIT